MRVPEALRPYLGGRTELTLDNGPERLASEDSAGAWARQQERRDPDRTGSRLVALDIDGTAGRPRRQPARAGSARRSARVVAAGRARRAGHRVGPGTAR